MVKRKGLFDLIKFSNFYIIVILIFTFMLLYNFNLEEKRKKGVRWFVRQKRGLVLKFLSFFFISGWFHLYRLRFLLIKLRKRFINELLKND